MYKSIPMQIDHHGNKVIVPDILVPIWQANQT
jgi:hypothetical protein